jgi:hypothetical protein
MVTHSSNHDNQQSLLPYDQDYVLIHKRTLAVNTATTLHVLENLASLTNSTVDEIGELIGTAMSVYIHSLSNEEICQMVDKLVEDTIKNSKQKIVISSNVENK